MDKQLGFEDLPQPEKVAGSGRDSWDSTGQVFFTGGKGFGVTSNLTIVCIGDEAEILAYLDTGAMPAHITPVAREILIGIKELKQRRELENGRTGNNKVESTTTQRAIGTGGVRARPSSHAEYIPVSTRHLKAGKRLSSGKA